MADDSPSNAPIQRATRVGLGREVIGGIDRRTHAGRRLDEVARAITSDLGGTTELTEAQRQLIRRVATMSLRLEDIETQAAAGGPFDAEMFVRLANVHLRYLTSLGLERRARDVTVDLDAYLARAATA